MALMKFREPNQVRWQGVRPAHNGTQVWEHKDADNVTIPIYTVPAGQVLYLCHASLSFLAIAAGGYALFVRDLLDAYYHGFIEGVQIAATDGLFVSDAYCPPIEVPAGFDIVVWSGAAGLNVRGTIHGWVE